MTGDEERPQVPLTIGERLARRQVTFFLIVTLVVVVQTLIYHT